MSVDDEEQLVLLCRHARTEANLDVIYAGRINDSVLPSEVPQIRSLAERLHHYGVGAIFSSPQVRALETAAPLSASSGIEITKDRRLAEMDMGPWQGMTAAQIAAAFPDEWAVWRSAPSEVRLSGFEGLTSVQDRSVDWLTTIPSDGGAVCCYTHETVIKTLLVWALGCHIDVYRQFEIANLGVSALRRMGNSWTVVMMNALPDINA